MADPHTKITDQTVLEKLYRQHPAGRKGGIVCRIWTAENSCQTRCYPFWIAFQMAARYCRFRETYKERDSLAETGNSEKWWKCEEWLGETFTPLRLWHFIDHCTTPAGDYHWVHPHLLIHIHTYIQVHVPVVRCGREHTLMVGNHARKHDDEDKTSFIRSR